MSIGLEQSRLRCPTCQQFKQRMGILVTSALDGMLTFCVFCLGLGLKGCRLEFGCALVLGGRTSDFLSMAFRLLKPTDVNL